MTSNEALENDIDSIQIEHERLKAEYAKHRIAREALIIQYLEAGYSVEATVTRFNSSEQYVSKLRDLIAGRADETVNFFL